MSTAFAMVRKADQVALLRPELQDPLLALLGLKGSPPPVVGAVQGRAAYPTYQLPEGTRAILKHYRHGGLLARLLGDRFFGLRRPLRELLLTERASQRGVPTVTLLAARIQSLAAFFYRGDVVLREIPGARDLGALLRDPPAPGRERNRLLRAVAATVCKMHEAGLLHRDLNLKNLLVAPDVTAYVVDLDQATLREHALGPAERAANLVRLARSYIKSGGNLGGSLPRRFLAAYCGRDRAFRARMRRQLRTLPLGFHLHRLGWKGAPR